MKRLTSLGRAVLAALSSKEARGYEFALLRLVLLALGAKLGFDFEQFLR